MFEKEAEEYYESKPVHTYVDSLGFFHDLEGIKQAYIQGRIDERKANEWKYVKDGDLPKGLPKPVLVAFNNKFSDKIVIDIARYSLELNKWWFIHDLKDLEEDVIAWKEIVLPELKE